MIDLTDEDLQYQIVDLMIDVYALAEHITTPEQMKSFIKSASDVRKHRRQKRLKNVGSEAHL